MVSREPKRQSYGVVDDQSWQSQQTEEKCLETKWLVGFGQHQGFERHEEVIGECDDTQIRGVDEEVARGQYAQLEIPLEFFDLVSHRPHCRYHAICSSSGNCMLVMSAV